MNRQLTTDTIQLAPPQKTDAEDLYRLRSHPEVNRFIQRTIPTSLADVESFIVQRQQQQDGFYFIIRTQPAAAFAGAICLWNMNTESGYAEVGYELLPELQGQGIMTAALAELIRFAFTDLQLETIEAFTHIDNLPSRKLLERAGFTPVQGKVDPDNAANVVYRLERVG